MLNKIPKLFALLLALVLVTGTVSAFAAPAEQAEGQTIVDIAVADGRFTTLVTALQAAGLVETLQGEGPFTVFAPTDEAFAKLPEGALDGLLADTEALTNVLLYHVVPGKVMAADVVNLTSADTVANLPVSIMVEGDVVKVGDAQVIIPDIEASNGVIHVIDTVLLPPAAEAPMAEEAVPAVCEQVYTVQGDDWLSKIADKFLGDVLAYQAIVEATNSAAAENSSFNQISNPNVIEVGWKLCIPAAGEEMMAEGQTIVDIAVADGRFTTLVTALQAAGLVETLQGEGPFTVFAPTDEAFAKLPEGALDGLLADTEALTNVLLYHVVPGKVMAADVVNLTSADTVANLPVSIMVEGDVVKVGDAQVIIPDIEASNGVIHVIDTVLLPPSQ